MVPVATPEELKPLEKEFGELLVKQQRYWWVPILNYLFFVCLLAVTAKYGWSITTLPPIILVVLLVTWTGYPKGDIEARLKEIRNRFEEQGFEIASEANLGVRVYKVLPELSKGNARS